MQSLQKVELSSPLCNCYKPKKLRDKLQRGHVKPGLHIVVTITEHVCDDASKGILKLSAYRLQIFLVEEQYL